MRSALALRDIVLDAYAYANLPPEDCVVDIIVTSDLDDPDTFAAEVKSILHPDGIWMIQMPHAVMPIRFLEHTLERHGLMVLDVKIVEEGDIRAIVCHAGREREKIQAQRVHFLREREVWEITNET